MKDIVHFTSSKLDNSRPVHLLGIGIKGIYGILLQMESIHLIV